MKIMTLLDASTNALLDTFSKACKSFRKVSEESNGTNINTFIGDINELVHSVETEGYNYLLLDEEHADMIAKAKERTPRANFLITNASQAKSVETPKPKPKPITPEEQATKLVRYNTERETYYIDLNDLVNPVNFYADTPPALRKEFNFDDISSMETSLLLGNIWLAYQVFQEDKRGQTLAILRATAENLANAELGYVDCIKMPHPEDYYYNPKSEDKPHPVVKFCQFVAGEKPFGFTVCHRAPVKRWQPKRGADRRFTVPHKGQFNLAVAETIPEESFEDAHFERKDDMKQLLIPLLTDYLKDGYISCSTLGEILQRQSMYAEEDGEGERFTSIKINLGEGSPLNVTALNYDIQTAFPGYPIRFTEPFPHEPSEG